MVLFTIHCFMNKESNLIIIDMRKLFVKFLAIVAMVMTGALSASAESFPTDGGAITLGEVYDVAFGGNYDATVTIPATGNLIQNGCPELLLDGASDRKAIGYGEYGQVFSWQVEAGKTYTISSGFVMSNGKVSFEMEGSKGLTLLSASPAEGSEIAITTMIDFVFSSDVTCSSAYLAVGDGQHPVSINASSLNSLSFNIYVSYTNLTLPTNSRL